MLITLIQQMPMLLALLLEKFLIVPMLALGLLMLALTISWLADLTCKLEEVLIETSSLGDADKLFLNFNFF